MPLGQRLACQPNANDGVKRWGLLYHEPAGAPNLSQHGWAQDAFQLCAYIVWEMKTAVTSSIMSYSCQGLGAAQFGTVSLLGYNALTWWGRNRTGEGPKRNLGGKRIDC